ncbi:monocarboxylate transporter 1-like [Patiria miniata]|uniref:Major facilitator superfamily (MFS) profile domain-containing protein n=1 Tax=Patiria miniata TaxID=46514 RepID=A0A913ZVK9_PATMI|nr:monocarboxylate transporter 1-like [Patiria miniata]
MRSSESDLDGGIHGWVGVLGTFASWFTWMGTVKCLAVMLPALQDQFNSHTWLVGWVIAIFDGSVDLTGPIAPAIKRRFGVRLVVVVSGLLVGFSLILSSFVSSLVQMTCILAFCTGPAVGVCNIVMRELVGECFPRSHTRAFAIGGIGASLSFVILAPLTQFFMDVYGWRGALMLIGSIHLHLAVCGALLKKHPETNQRNGDYEMVTSTSSEDKTAREEFRCLSVLTSMKNAVNIDLFAFAGYWLVVLMALFTTVAATAWIVYFAAHTNQYKGFLPGRCRRLCLCVWCREDLWKFSHRFHWRLSIHWNEHVDGTSSDWQFGLLPRRPVVGILLADHGVRLYLRRFSGFHLHSDRCRDQGNGGRGTFRKRPRMDRIEMWFRQGTLPVFA